MQINDTLEEIRAANMVPQDHYKFLVVRTGSPQPPDTSWAVLDVKVIATKDPQTAHMIDQELKFWVIGRKTGRKDLGDFLQHKHIYDPEGHWDQGIPADSNGEKLLSSLVGVTFDAQVESFEYKNGDKAGTWGYNIHPITHPDQPMLEVPENTVPY